MELNVGHVLDCEARRFGGTSSDQANPHHGNRVVNRTGEESRKLRRCKNDSNLERRSIAGHTSACHGQQRAKQDTGLIRGEGRGSGRRPSGGGARRIKRRWAGG